MKNEINLLPPKKSQGKNNKQARTLRVVSIGILLLVTTVSVGAFLVTLFSPLPRLKEEEAATAKELDAYQKKAVSYLIANQRLAEAGKFITSRHTYPQAMADMQSTAGEEIEFTGISIAGNTVGLTIASPSLQSINSIVNDLANKSENEKMYSHFSLSSLEYSKEDSKYKLGLNVELKK